MFTVSSSFIGNFKIGDNIHYNLNVLRALYEARFWLNDEDQKFFEKPITVILVSVCEAIIFDLIGRSRFFTTEGVGSLSDQALARIRASKTWTFERKIKLLRELELLGSSGLDTYDELENLAKLRNRIHIQNENQNFEADEERAFTTARRVKAEIMVEKIIDVLNDLYPRPDHIAMSKYVDDFPLPWDRHIPEF